MTFGAAAKVKPRGKSWSPGAEWVPELPVAWLDQSPMPCLGLPLFSAKANSPASAYSLSSGTEQEFWDGEEKREGRRSQGQRASQNSPGFRTIQILRLLLSPKSWIWTHQLGKRRPSPMGSATVMYFRWDNNCCSTTEGQITPVLPLLEDLKASIGLRWPSLNTPSCIKTHPRVRDSDSTPSFAGMLCLCD